MPKERSEEVIDNKFNTLYANLLAGVKIDDTVVASVRKQVIGKASPKEKAALEEYFSTEEEIFRNVKGLFQRDPQRVASEIKEIMRKEHKTFDEAAYRLTGAARN